MSTFESVVGLVLGQAEAGQALPATWYTSKELYELERRAIYSKKWLLTTHKSRIPNSGDWLRFDVAGFDFVITRDRTGTINAFHNVCRHRAYPIVDGDKGHNNVLSCKYHGWSYGLNGKLAKAPGYQDLPGFDKAQNNLFSVHVHTDVNGFIWVNMDAAVKPENPWTDDIEAVDTQQRFKAYDFGEYEFDHTWEVEGEWNWKIMADGQILPYGSPTPEQVSKGSQVSSAYYFPSTSMNVSPHLFFMQRFEPSGPTKTIMKCEVYRNKNATDEDFSVIADIQKRVSSEDAKICAAAQRNLDAGLINEPTLDKGPLAFHDSVRELMQSHYKREAEKDAEIWPARQVLPESAKATETDIGFCSNVDCCRLKKKEMAF
ncbi:choline monooxygenase [Dactylonectria macrodidyma]|uniref:Choline monooxygenase, chloroplastic n=1 Tax=Dactylonectria macrodidyma TaxID=307937 RepID=A0A9P9E939_9HYPO|nr:choline monooxygenase [Dactylonectria macrodidyma]